MGDLSRTIDKARRRVAADIALARAGAWLALGSLAGLCVLAAERLWGVPVWAGTYALLPGGAAMLAAATALGAVPRRLATAVRLDRALRLKDRLGTAEAAQEGSVRGDFADLARHHGERLAARLDVRAAAPIRIRPLWGGCALAAILGAGVAYLPHRAAAEAESLPEPAQAQRTQLAETIERAAADLAEDGASPESVQDVEALEELAAQLAGDGGDAHLQETRDRSAARLEEAAKRLAEHADRQLQAADESTRRFAGIEAPPVPGAPPQADAFMDALREGELEDAAGQFDRLMEEMQELPPDAREALAEQLDRMSEELRNEPPPPPETPEAGESMAEALQDLGVEEEAIDDLLRQEDPEELKRRLEESPADPQTIDEIARDLQEMKRQQEIDRQVADEQERMAEALQEAARRARDTKPPQEQEQERGNGHEEQPKQPKQQQQQQQQEQQQSAEGDRTAQQPAQESGREPRDASQPGSGEQERTVTAPDPAAGSRPPDAPQEPRPQTSPAPDRQGTADADSPKERRTPDAGAPPSPAGEPTVGEVLRRLAEKRRDAEGRQEMSERLRRAARGLADSMTEEEKERLAEQWAARGARDPEPGTGAGGDPTGGPGADSAADPARSLFDATEDVDLRGPGSPGEETVISEWLGQEGEAAQAPGGSAQAFVRRAQADAEQAVEQSAVPSRYHALIRRYFGRLADTVEAAAPPTPPAPDESPP